MSREPRSDALDLCSQLKDGELFHGRIVEKQLQDPPGLQQKVLLSSGLWWLPVWKDVGVSGVMGTSMVLALALFHVQERGIESRVVEVEVAVGCWEQVLVLLRQKELEQFLQGNQDEVPFPYQFQNLTLEQEFFLYIFI